MDEIEEQIKVAQTLTRNKAPRLAKQAIEQAIEQAVAMIQLRRLTAYKALLASEERTSDQLARLVEISRRVKGGPNHD